MTTKQLKRARGPATRVLVVDDNPQTLADMTEALKAPHRSITALGDGFAAREFISAHAAELNVVVSDLNFRRGPANQPTGDELCRLARSINPNVKTLLVSGDLSDADRSSVDAPIQKTLDKKVDAATLRHHVKKLEDQIKKKETT